MADYATARGQREEVALADGSRVYLDGNSAIDVTINQSRREVRLLRGRIWFDVKHDETMNFRIFAGDVETHVLGTAFSVERQAGVVTVAVERGRVAVAPKGQDAETVLSAKQRVRVEPGMRAAIETIDPETVLGWRRGLIIFDRASLAAVVDELDRLTPRRVILVDENLHGLTLSGVFRAEDPEAVFGALRSVLGVRIQTIPGFATFIYR
jgi:transmembrane sensor